MKHLLFAGMQALVPSWPAGRHPLVEMPMGTWFNTVVPQPEE